MKVALNAIPVAHGGGLTVLLGLLDGWRRLGLDLTPVILASHPRTLKALQEAGWGACTQEAPLRSSRQAYRWQRKMLGSWVAGTGADLLLTNTYYIPRCPCAQLVHHQNLWTLYARSVLAYLPHGPRFMLLALGAREALAKAEGNIFISNYMRDCAERIAPESRPRNWVVPNGLNSEFTPPPERDGRPGFRGVICAVQPPSRHKRTGELIAALGLLMKWAPEVEWRLRIAGGGDWAGYRRQIARLGLSDRVEFLGPLDLPAIVTLFRESDCLVYPSDFEGFGLPIIEAMSQGCPVIACNATAIPDVAGSAALLVPPRDAEAIARAIESLRRNPELRNQLMKRGELRAREFSWTNSAAECYRAFETVLSAGVLGGALT